MAGNENGPVITLNDPDSSLILVKTAEVSSHFAQFSSQELMLVEQWISAGALE